MNIFNIRPKELQLVTILLLMFFGISVASITGSAVRDAVFLIKYNRDYLPLMYVLIAIVMTFLMEIYKRLITNKDPFKLFTMSVSFFAISLTAFHQNLYGPMIPILYVWIEGITILTILQFWMLAGELLNTRQAKRIFPIIIAGGSFAAIGSGYFIRPFVRQYGSDNLLIITIVSLGFSVLLGQFLKFHRSNKIDPKESLEKTAKHKNLKLTPYLKHITLMVACSAFISRVVDYQFKVMAANAFPLQNELVSFFGSYYMLTGAATLLMQALITGLILTRFGILAGLIFLPITLVFGSIGFLIFGSMIAIFVLKFSDQVFKFSMYNAIKEILWLPLTTIKKNRYKPFIDGTIKSIVEGVAGLTIFFLVSFKLIPDTKIYLLSLLVLFFAAYWFWNSFRLKRGYLSEIVKSIENRQLNLDDVKFDLNDLSTVNALKSSLEDEDDFKKLFAIDLLWTLPLKPWKRTIQDQFVKGSNEVKRGILELCWSKNEIITDKMILDQIQLREEISAYAISCANDRKISDQIESIESYMDHDNLILRSSVLATMINDEPNDFKTLEVISAILKGDEEKEIIALLQFLKKSNFDIQENLVQQYLRSKNTQLVVETLRIISHKPKDNYINKIIDLLGHKSIYPEAVKTLLKYDKMLISDRLLEYLSDSNSNTNIKISILGFIHHFENDKIKDLILSVMEDPDLNFLNACATALVKISKFDIFSKNDLDQVQIIIHNISLRVYQLHLFKNELLNDQKSTLLIDHIEYDIKRLGHLILKLGTLDDPTIPIESYIRYVDSNDTDLLPLVLELVDSSFSNKAKKLVLPLIDPEMDPIQIASTFLGEKALSKDEMLKFWVENPHHWKTNIATQFLLDIKNNDVMKKIKWNELPEESLDVRYFSKSKQEYLIQNFHINNFTNKESNEMYSVLEKTLLLKSVELFKTIPGHVLSKIAQIATEVQADINDQIFNEGEYGDSLYIIISGAVSVIRKGKSIATLEQGNCIGEMALLDQEPRSAGAIALDESILLKIDQEGFYELMSNNPDIMKQIVMMLTHRVREMNKRLTGSL